MLGKKVLRFTGLWLEGLGEALRNTEKISKELTPLSSVAYGATRWPGFKVFA